MHRGSTAKRSGEKYTVRVHHNTSLLKMSSGVAYYRLLKCKWEPGFSQPVLLKTGTWIIRKFLMWKVKAHDGL